MALSDAQEACIAAIKQGHPVMFGWTLYEPERVGGGAVQVLPPFDIVAGQNDGFVVAHNTVLPRPEAPS